MPGLSKQLESETYPWTAAIVLYLCAHGLSLLFLNAIYWDDWTIVDAPSSVIVDAFRQAGWMLSWPGHLQNGLLVLGPWAYRVLTLALMFATGVVVWLITRTVTSLSRQERNAIAILFLVLPLNAARVALINIHYTICYFVFFLAWYLLVCRKGKATNALALILFIFAFSTNSFLAFFLAPIVHKAVNETSADIRRLPQWCLRNAAFLAAPFLFFAVKLSFFRPYGYLVGYNSISTKGFLVGVGIGLLLVVGFVAARRTRTTLPGDSRAMGFIWIGAFLTWLAIFPYVAVLHAPIFSEWNSRNQLLMPLGVSTLCVGLALWLTFSRMDRIIPAAIYLSVAVCAYFNYEYLVDWRKQQEVVRVLALSDEVRNAKTIVMDDRARSLNARARHFRFYEFNGWFERAFGDESRFALSADDWVGSLCDIVPAAQVPRFPQFYMAADYHRGPPEVIVVIRELPLSGLFERLSMMGSNVSLRVQRLRCDQGGRE